MRPRSSMLVLALLVAGAPPTWGQEAGGGWAWIVSPYLLFPHMSGTAGIGPVDSEVDASPSDVFEHLQFGAMVTVEARSAEWAAAFDGIYMDLGKDGEDLPSELSMYQAALELAAFRRVAGWAEVLAGGRLNLMGGSARGPLGNEFELDEAWFDPFIGARLSTTLGGAWTGTLRADIGGFGIGSDLVWQVHPTVEYRASSLIGAGVGYRVISIDYESGNGGERFAYDVRTFGPELGVLFHF